MSNGTTNFHHQTRCVMHVDGAAIPPALRQAPILAPNPSNEDTIAAYNAHTARLGMVGPAPVLPPPPAPPARIQWDDVLWIVVVALVFLGMDLAMSLARH